MTREGELSEALFSLSRAALELGTDRKTVAGLVKALQIATHRLPTNAKAKAIDARGMEALRRSLTRPGRRTKAAS